jgi:hypothetical protein
MEAYRELLKKNEAAVNRLASRVSRIELYIMILIGVLCKYYVMYVPGFTLGRMLSLIFVPLLLPTLIVDMLHIEKPWSNMQYCPVQSSLRDFVMRHSPFSSC